MSELGKTVIVGGGLAGARAAEGLRDAGYEGSIALVAAEGKLPYERPPLSKGYLLGDDELDVVFPHDEAWYADHGIELHLASLATALDADAHSVEVEGRRIRYDRLLIATGASPRRFPGPGGRLRGVHHLRRIEDAVALRTAFEGEPKRVAIIGAGWIGLEVAAAARHHGHEVAVFGRGSIPLEAAVGATIGEMFAELHREHGVELRMGVEVDRLREADGAVDAVLTADGAIHEADIVVVGIGAAPNTALAASAGLTIEDGIATDAAFRTSAPEVFAVGDAASTLNPTLGRRIRVEHWANALNAGYAAGRSMAGERIAYDEIPYFYTDQYDLGMEYSGYGERAAHARLVIRGDLASREFIGFWLDEGRVVAGMNVNVWEVNDTVQQLIRSGRRVNRDRLTDPDVPLESLLEGE
ncbi:NAD(P)/FAD-dependent oxidoreductase [Agromyces archimandritae]|uniref:FAD-dependent oxidoreductase n=1 Tax=Agromyces archimandritae TaxID=2781962 RepID=A0A975IMX6_9MICO|nr:FAD-dependent oxidoreductase [Agromyces archimandritae]QTX03998.1 FAD-dependent oxidoreductase [Agromyces archimandritae]